MQEPGTRAEAESVGNPCSLDRLPPRLTLCLLPSAAQVHLPRDDATRNVLEPLPSIS